MYRRDDVSKWVGNLYSALTAKIFERAQCASRTRSSFHFASAFVAVIFSQLMASSSASWRLNKPPSSFVSGHRTRVDNMFHGLLLSAVTEWRWGKTPFMHFSTTLALTCAETVQQCPEVARQVEARLLDSRAAYKMTVDHSSRQPVFFPLHSLVDRSCVCPDRASSYESFLRVIKHIGIQRPVRMGLDGREVEMLDIFVDFPASAAMEAGYNCLSAQL